MDKARWELTGEQRCCLYRNGEGAWSQFLMPVNNVLRFEEPRKLLITTRETVRFAWGLAHAIAGDVPMALYEFEQRLLPDADKRGPTWHACLFLWSALCRLFMCDPETALKHITRAEEEGLTDIASEIPLLKGMAFRLKGDIESAMSTLRPVTRRVALSPTEDAQARAWMLESQAAVGRSRASAKQLELLDRKSRHVYQDTLGIVVAALYRVAMSKAQPVPGLRTPEELLNALDNAPAFQRPMLTMLLQDILPRPLAGVERTDVRIESYWE